MPDPLPPAPTVPIGEDGPPPRPALQQRTLTRYGVAVLLVVGVTLLRLPLAPWLGNSVPFILYFPALVVAGWFGGRGPGLVATAVSGYCAKTWFFEPYGTFSLDDWPSVFRLLLFLMSGALISFLCGQLHRRNAELMRQRENLTATVQERTRHLERALHDMEAFSYSVSHDLRAPLRSIEGFSEVLLEDQAPSLNADGRRHLERIHSATIKLTRLVDDLLGFAQASGRTAELAPVSVQEAIDGVRQSSPELTSPDVEITCERCDVRLLGNAALLQQVLKNLLENAVKFVPVGTKPVVRVIAERRGDAVRLWVIDNGIGIASEQQARLFKLFERLEPNGYAGTGIGLATVERAVARMNGRVGVESERGAGSKFWVELPEA